LEADDRVTVAFQLAFVAFLPRSEADDLVTVAFHLASLAFPWRSGLFRRRILAERRGRSTWITDS
jgi:hypothetical protein